HAPAAHRPGGTREASRARRAPAPGGGPDPDPRPRRQGDHEADDRAADRAALDQRGAPPLAPSGGARRRPHSPLAALGRARGARIARDAAMRGLRTALVEHADFASGTSSRSSKLIHGGFRYLEQGDVRLVLEACRERERLRRLAPHLVRPQEFIFPVYEDGPVGRFKLAAGLWASDLMAGLWNVHRHRLLSARGTPQAAPA